MILRMAQRFWYGFFSMLARLCFRLGGQPKPLGRMLVLVKPKQPFFNWARQHGDDLNLTLAQIAREVSTAFLIAKLDEDEQAGNALLDEYWQYFFAHMLSLEVFDQAKWPQERTLVMFRHWFQVECCDMVLDMP